MASWSFSSMIRAGSCTEGLLMSVPLQANMPWQPISIQNIIIILDWILVGLMRNAKKCQKDIVPWCFICSCWPGQCGLLYKRQKSFLRCMFRHVKQGSRLESCTAPATVYRICTHQNHQKWEGDVWCFEKSGDRPRKVFVRLGWRQEQNHRVYICFIFIFCLAVCPNSLTVHQTLMM